MLTLLESSKYSDDDLQAGVMRIIAERSPILEMIPWDDADGNGYTYRREQNLPGVAFRAVNEDYPKSTGTIEMVTEHPAILGGDIYLDNFQVKTQSNKIKLKAEQWRMKAKATSLVFSEKFFEGDSTVNLKEFDGLRPRITGTALQDAAVGGAALTLDMLDQLIDGLIGSGEDGKAVLFMNKTLRRKVTKLGRDVAGGAFSLLDLGNDAYGKQVNKYNGVSIRVIERDDNEATYLGFDEDSANAVSHVCSSIYLVKFGDNYVHGVRFGGSDNMTYDLGESQVSPGILGRIDWYVTIAVRHPRSAIRLRGITG